MLKELISQGNFAIWPQISLILFFTTFVGILLWVRRKGSEGHYQYMADLADNSGEIDRAESTASQPVGGV